MEKLKTILAIVGLLLIGFVSGFISHRQLVKKEFTRVSKMGEAPVFRQHLLEVLAPNADQRTKINPILEAHSKQMMQVMQENRQKRKALIAQLETELEPILNDDQKKKLKQFNRRFKRPENRQPGRIGDRPPSGKKRNN
jgi:uncharacterized membrane protein